MDQLQVDLLQTMSDLAELLERGNFDYMVTGSVALGFHAEPRTTRDVDVVIEIEPKRADKLVRLLQDRFEVQAEMVEEEVARRGMFNVFHKSTVFKVDFIVLGRDEMSKEQLARRQQAEAGGRKYWVISPEDLVIAKLLWARDSHSDLQLRDVNSVLKTNPALDLDYINSWVARLGLSDLWEEVRNE